MPMGRITYRTVFDVDAERLAREVKGPAELVMVEDGNHIANNRAYRWRPQTADWMAERHQLWRLEAYNKRTLSGLIGAARAAVSALAGRLRRR